MVINPIVGVYIPITRIPIKGGMTIPNIATFDHGTYGEHMTPGNFLKDENEANRTFNSQIEQWQETLVV